MKMSVEKKHVTEYSLNQEQYKNVSMKASAVNIITNLSVNVLFLNRLRIRVKTKIA